MLPNKSGIPAAVLLSVCLLAPGKLFAANHREAPITALDHKADITDVFAFRSYDPAVTTPSVTLILCVDPLLEPGNGPNWFPFDPDILYTINIDNNHDGLADIQFQFRFTTQQTLPGVFQVYVGAGNGVTAPSNAPRDSMGNSTVGQLVVPPAINSLTSPGMGQRQTYAITMVKNYISSPLGNAQTLYTVPPNVGPRTMPNYDALFSQGIYDLGNGVHVFAGTVDDPFWIDLGGAFDTLNLRAMAGGGVLTPGQDADDHTNTAPDFVSGYAVNAIAIEVPVAMLTSTGKVESATSPNATIGVWATTSRPGVSVRTQPPSAGSGTWQQVQRMGNPLINELIIGTGSKDRFSMDQPVNDRQFASFFLDPLLARVLNAAAGIQVPNPPRTDLLPLVTYAPPIAAPGTPPGPVADLLRLNTGVPPTPLTNARRLGLLAGDAAGYPNGRRLYDDVTDISLRAVAGVLAGPPFNRAPNTLLGDGVNTNDVPYRTTFPYLADSPSGRNRRHIDPGEPGCTMGAGNPCPVQ